MCTHECQSKLPKNAGCRSRGEAMSGSPPMTWSSLAGNSRLMFASACRTNDDARTSDRLVAEEWPRFNKYFAKSAIYRIILTFRRPFRLSADPWAPLNRRLQSSTKKFRSLDRNSRTRVGRARSPIDEQDPEL